jgi:uncharacterized membrane protein
MHSLVIVGPCLALTAVLYPPALPFFVGMLAHGIVDLPTHRQWAYKQLPENLSRKGFVPIRG